MSILETLIDRTSTPPRLMEETDGPTPSDIQDILRAAMSAPDHGSVRPWRFVIIEGDDRAILGRVFADALKTRDPGATEEAIAKEINRPLRAPVVIAILARVVHDRPNVPEIEQIVATACAAQNMLLAANAKGFGGILLTGKNAKDKNVRAFFGLKPGDEIVSFLYLGKSKSDQPTKPRPDPAQFIEKFGAMRT
jgi:nitroreductase